MTKKIHVTAGVATVLAISLPITQEYISNLELTGIAAVTTGVSLMLPGVICAKIGSFAVDLDYPKELAGISNKRLTAEQLDRKYNHRGWLHTLIIPLILLLLFMPSVIGRGIRTGNWIAVPGIFDGLFIGWVVHLFADSFTPKGIMFGFPITKKPFSFANIPGLRFFSNKHGLWLAVYLLFTFMLYSLISFIV